MATIKIYTDMAEAYTARGEHRRNGYPQAQVIAAWVLGEAYKGKGWVVARTYDPVKTREAFGFEMDTSLTDEMKETLNRWWGEAVDRNERDVDTIIWDAYMALKELTGDDDCPAPRPDTLRQAMGADDDRVKADNALARFARAHERWGRAIADDDTAGPVAPKRVSKERHEVTRRVLDHYGDALERGHSDDVEFWYHIIGLLDDAPGDAEVTVNNTTECRCDYGPEGHHETPCTNGETEAA